MNYLVAAIGPLFCYNDKKPTESLCEYVPVDSKCKLARTVSLKVTELAHSKWRNQDRSQVRLTIKAVNFTT